MVKQEHKLTYTWVQQAPIPRDLLTHRKESYLDLTEYILKWDVLADCLETPNSQYKMLLRLLTSIN